MNVKDFDSMFVRKPSDRNATVNLRHDVRWDAMDDQARGKGTVGEMIRQEQQPVSYRPLLAYLALLLILCVGGITWWALRTL